MSRISESNKVCAKVTSTKFEGTFWHKSNKDSWHRLEISSNQKPESFRNFYRREWKSRRTCTAVDNASFVYTAELPDPYRL